MFELTGPELPAPRWHILKCMSGREARLTRELHMSDIETAYPVKEVKFFALGKWRSRFSADVPGYVFAKFRAAPIWAEFKRRNLITGVVTVDSPHGPIPYIATANDVRLFMGLPTAEEQAERDRLEAMRLQVGDKARVMLAGDISLAVTITGTGSGVVWWETPEGIKGSASTERATKVA